MRAQEFIQEGWRENLAAAGIAGALATATPAQAQAQPTASADPIVATVVIDGEQRRLDLSAKNFGDVREAERWLAKFMRDRGIVDWQGKIERGQPGSGRYQRITIQGAGGLDEQDVSEDSIKESKTMEVVVIGPNRRLEKRRIRIDPTTRDPVDAIIRYYARLGREVFGIEGRPVDRAKALAEGSIITEVPQGVMNILRQELPGWPDYVIKDMVYNKLKSPQDLESKLEHVRHLAQEAKSWRLVQDMPLTFNMLDPETQQRMKLRKFGDANPFKIPNDRERFEHALELVKTKGMENLPPVIFKQTANGLDLWEGWHRTLAAFRLHPKMFRVNAWIGSER